MCPRLGNLGGRARAVTCSRLPASGWRRTGSETLASKLSGPAFDNAADELTARGQFIIGAEPALRANATSVVYDCLGALDDARVCEFDVLTLCFASELPLDPARCLAHASPLTPNTVEFA